MKKNLKYIFIALSLLTFGSCTDLEEVAYSDLPTDKFEPKESDLFRLIGPSYTTLRSWLFGWHGYFDAQEECSDIIVTPARPNGWIDGGVYRAMHMHIWNSEQSHVGRIWSECFSGIISCNLGIEGIQDGTIPMDSTKQTSLISELKVLRAFYYYILCDNFGNVPIIEQYTVPTGFLPEQSTRKQVFDFVIEEVTENIDNLSRETTGEYYGRVNRWFAYTLLAKMYLNAEVYIGEDKYAECIVQCDSVINSGLYELDPKYRNIFSMNNESSPEIIFAIPFAESTDGSYGWFHLCFKTLHPANQSTYNFNYAPWGGSCAIPQFINTYDTADKRLKDSWIMGQQYSSSGDTLYCTLDQPTKPLAYVNLLKHVKNCDEDQGYRIGKFEIGKGLYWGGMGNDWPLFRYADILMMKAESLLRTGDADAAAAIVTEVRQRDFDNPADATVTGAELSAGSSYNYGIMTNGIMKTTEGGADIQFGRMLDELGWEFAAEVHRRQDLIRFGVFTTKSWFSHEPSDSYRTLFPIPEEELTANPNLDQNDGY